MLITAVKEFIVQAPGEVIVFQALGDRRDQKILRRKMKLKKLIP
jgi:hypothetical protein